MNLKQTTVQFREDPKTLEAFDQIAEAEGLGRSSLLRQLIRDKIRMEADSATNQLAERIRKFR